MRESIEDKIKDALKGEIELPIKYRNMIRNTLKEENIEWRKYTMKKKLIAGLCTGIALTSSVVFAANFDKIVASFGLGKGIDTAVQNGYISETNMDYINSNTNITDDKNSVILNDINVDAKIENFLMDDLNISTHFKLKLDNKINETIDLEKSNKIDFKDLIVTDEENRILYCMNEEAFNKYCEDNRLDYSYSEYNENYYNCGLNSFIENYDKENGILEITYNMYLENENFPKSKKINFKFTKIEIKEENNSPVYLNGNWKMSVEVPEEMYNRKKEYYRIISYDNENFEIYNATISETGFEIGIIINNIKEPENFPREKIEIIQKLSNEPDKLNISIEEAEKIRSEWYSWLDSREPISVNNNNLNGEETNASYVENENGEKFYCSKSPSRKASTKYIDGNRYNFYETFELTKYDSSDILKLVLFYDGEPVIIELQRVK